MTDMDGWVAFVGAGPGDDGLLTMRAASMKDAGMKTTLESSMAKLYASEVAVRCANEGVQIHGGYGSSKTIPPKSSTAT